MKAEKHAGKHFEKRKSLFGADKEGLRRLHTLGGSTRASHASRHDGETLDEDVEVHFDAHGHAHVDQDTLCDAGDERRLAA